MSSREREVLESLAGRFSEEDLTRFFQILLRTEGELRYSLQPRFHLELGLIKLVHAGKLVPLESLLSQLSAAAEPVKPADRVKPEGEPPAPGRKPASIPPPMAGQRQGTTRPAGALRGEPKREAAGSAGPGGVSAPSGREWFAQGRESPGIVPPAPSPADLGPDRTAPARVRETPLDGEAARARIAPPVGEDARLAAIKALLFEQSKKLLSSCLEHVSGWRFEDGEVRFLYSKQSSFYADLLNSREQQENLRSACSTVLGQPVRICVTLVSGGEQAAPARPSARDRASRDPLVEAFRRRFDGTLVDAEDLSQE